MADRSARFFSAIFVFYRGTILSNKPYCESDLVKMWTICSLYLTIARNGAAILDLLLE